MKFALFSLVMNIPIAITRKALTAQQTFQNVLKGRAAQQVERFARDVASVLRRAIPGTVWDRAPVTSVSQ